MIFFYRIGGILFVTMVWLLSFFLSFFFSLLLFFPVIKTLLCTPREKKKKALCICILYVVVDICG